MSIDGVLLARHGETDDNAARRFQGHRDPPLNERGLEPRVDPRLMEVDVGGWARLYADLATDEPDAYAEWRSGSPAFRFPGGESLGEQGDRVAEVLRVARRVLAGAPPGMPVVANGTVHRL